MEDDSSVAGRVGLGFVGLGAALLVASILPAARVAAEAPGAEPVVLQVVASEDPAETWAEIQALRSAEPVSLDQAPEGVWTGVNPGRKSVLVYMNPKLDRGGAERAAVKQFAVARGGFVRYEYTTAMPEVLNLRNLAPADIERLKQMRGVVRVEEDMYHPYVLELDEATPLIRALQSQITGAGLSADGSGVRVCVCDTGIDMDHIMYASRIDASASWDFANDDSNPDDDHGHGSHVSGIAVGGTGLSVDFGCEGSEPFQGVAPAATLIGAKILNQFGGGTDSDIIAGIDHCADQSPSGGRADVINLSIGTGNFAGVCTHSWAVASNNAVANGVVVVAASGNENNSNSMGSPACGADVIAVGATYKDDYPNCEDGTSTFNWSVCTDVSPSRDQVVCFSNESDLLDVAAPGSVIWSASNAAGGSSIAGMSGTSMASPAVAGLAALILSADNTLTPAEVRQIIRDGAIDMGPAGFDRGYGFGRVDAINSLSLVVPCVTNGDCDDGDPCTTDVCTSGSCSNTPISCPPGQTCIGGTCLGEGACCNGETCSINNPNACATGGGIYLGDGTECGSGTAGNPTTYQDSPNVTIPDGGGPGNPATDTLNVPDSFTIGDVNVELVISHTWVGDLTVTVSHLGTTVTVLDRPGVPGSTFGCSADNYNGAELDDEGTGGAIESACAANLSSPPNYTPNNPLSAFDGMDAAGIWTITVYDSVSADGGTLNTWALHIDAIGSNPCVGGCSIDADCDDGVFCNGAETCNAGTCQAGTPVNCNDGVACTDDSCNEATDSCDNVPIDGNCDNGLFCDGSETCNAVFGCQAGAAVNCNDGVACTVDSCNESTDSCDNVPNNGLCDDGLFCNGAETCSAVFGCQAGSDPCPGQPCDEVNDVCIECTVNGDCDDGLFCNGSETCSGGSCQAGTPVNCNDGVACTDDSCNEGTDSCENVANDANCNDGAFCNGVETCHATLGCQAGTAVNCDDGVACTDDSCNEGTDSCDNTPNDANCDDGLFCNGAETCSAVAGCQAGSDPCGGNPCDEGTDTCQGGAELWMSFKTNTFVPGVGTVTDDDIVAFDLDTSTWSLVFDGSDVGIGSLEIDGLAVLPSGDILMSFTADSSVPGLVGGPSGTSVDDSDIVRFVPTSLGSSTSGTFFFYFDGSDVGLTSSSEDIDALALAADGSLIISTLGGVSAAGASGADEDLLIFSAVSLGSSTSGSFSLYFDGSDVGLNTSSSEDIDGASLTAAGDILFSTVGLFSVSGASGDDEDVGEFVPTSLGPSTSGSFSLFLDLSALGIDPTEDIGSLFLIE